jgi:hypothetical protein
MFIRAFSLAACVLLPASLASAQDFAILSPAAVRALRTQADTPQARATIREADAALTRSPHPMPRLHTEGTLEHQGIRDQSIEAEKDFNTTEDLAFAYRLTGNKRYLAQTAVFFDAWFSTYKVSGNPIDETKFDPMFLALDLTRGDLPPATQLRAVEFFRGMAVNYLDWLDQNFANDAYNWSSHRVKLAVLGAYESGDPALIDRAAHAYTRQVRQNIRPDGSVMDFYKRDALHYVVYSLEPLTTAAIAARAHGHDWFHTAATGSPSIEMAIDWLIPFALGKQTHQEFVHSPVKFDAQRNQAGEPGYSGLWDPKGSVDLLALASWLDPKYTPVLEKVESNTGAKAPAWIVLAMGASNSYGHPPA